MYLLMGPKTSVGLHFGTTQMLQMVHAFSFHLEGKCAWKIKIPDVSDDSAPSDTYSSRVAAWNVGILGP